jgi:ribonuclease BN (tRNA processing enzyme)
VETRSRVPVYAPAGLRDLMRSASTTSSDTDTDTDPAFAWHDITGRQVTTIGPFRFTFARTDHPPETLAMRVDADGHPTAFGYSADTGPGWSLKALGPNLGVAISEATFLQDREGTSPHLSARQAGRQAREADVERLLISHIWPIVDPKESEAEASQAFGAPVERAQMNASYQL